ncbi:MAG: hypothetical protein MJK14_03605 [Rivularia sp. ALOHA_DT_140]|nr:hypothetical protein [Rivularia sp. ALOHA_DT_140]
MFKSKISASLIIVNALAGLSIASTAFAATPPQKPGCPEGWVPAPNPQLGCIPNKVKAPGLRKPIKKTTPSKQVQFPHELPEKFKVNHCELGVVDPIDCPENNPIPAPRD